ncbi:MAG: PIG-L family deacetylase [Acidimicrobiia bacterium]
MPYTLVAFHAHPDDEAIATGGVMARAAADGHRVVLVVATRGELGEVAEGVLADGEALWQRRVAETYASADILGVSRVEFLGYHDSGMLGEPTNDAPGSFWSAPVDEAAARLAEILREESADVLTVYDSHGVYGHPDHVQVHRVGVRAAQLAGTPRVYETTLNRDHVMRLAQAMRDFDLPEGATMPDVHDLQMGVHEHLITTTVDVRDFVDRKRAAMAAHGSQITEEMFFLAMPIEAFREAFGYEWFIRHGAPSELRETNLFEELP